MRRIMLLLIICFIIIPSSYVSAKEYLNQKELGFVNVTEWHENGFTGKGVKIVLDDSGCVDLSWFNGKAHDPLNTVNCIDTYNSHAQNSAQIVHEIAPDAEIYIINKPSAISALRYAIENDAQIVNRSLSNVYGEWEKEWSEKAYNKGVFLTLSAGNSGSENMNPFASDEHWFSVGAMKMLNGNINRANYSAYGPHLDIMGFSHLSLYYEFPSEKTEGTKWAYNGTSAAAPFITGMVALYFDYYNQQYGHFPTVETARNFIISNSIDYGTKGHDEYYGHGLFVLPKLDGQKKECEFVPVESNPLAVETVRPDGKIWYVHINWVDEYTNDKGYALSKCN